MNQVNEHFSLVIHPAWQVWHIKMLIKQHDDWFFFTVSRCFHMFLGRFGVPGLEVFLPTSLVSLSASCQDVRATRTPKRRCFPFFQCSEHSDSSFQCLTDKGEQRKQYNDYTIHYSGETFRPSTKCLLVVCHVQLVYWHFLWLHKLTWEDINLKM